MKSTVLKGLKASGKGIIADALRFNSGSSGSKGGGPFKERGTAKQAQFFHKKDKELIENLRKQMKELLGFHEKQIEVHQAAMKKIKKNQKDNKA